MCLKKTKVELVLLTDATTGRKTHQKWNCHAIYCYAKVSNMYIKDYNSNTELTYLMYWDDNNLHGWMVSQRLPVDGCKWRRDLFRLMETLYKAMMKTAANDTSLKLIIIISRSCTSYTWSFLTEKTRLISAKN